MSIKDTYFSQNHKEAAMSIYSMVVWDAVKIPSKMQAAQILADKLDISKAIPLAWFRGAFKNHPVSAENFARIVIGYRGKRGLETNQDIINLAINLYGREYQRPLSLIEIWPEKENPDLDWQVLANKLLIYHPFGEDISLLGALPQLLYYDLEVFQSLWKLPEYLALEKLELLEKHGFITRLEANRWEVDTAMLGIAKKFFDRLSKKQQKEVDQWKRRMLKGGFFLAVYRSQLIIRLSDFTHLFDFSSSKRLRKELGIYDFITYPFAKRFLMTFRSLGSYDADWDVLQAFKKIMKPEQFLYGLFLQSRWKVVLINTMGIILLLSASIFVHQISISARFLGGLLGLGWFACVLLYLHKIDKGWISLWKEILPLIPQK
jgi:hypothetical protein